MTSGRATLSQGYMSAGLRQKQSPRQKLVQTPSMQMTMRIMGARISAVRKYAQERADENPMLELSMPSLPSSTAGTIDIDGFASEDLREISLTDHVMGQINQIFTDADDRYLAAAMVPYLSPAGWLDEEAEKASGLNKNAFERILRRLQTMTPSGLWARDLRECLALQCHDRGVWSDKLGIVLDHLESILDGDISTITGLSDHDVAEVMAIIRTCNPKPGAAFLYDDGDIFTPDLILTATDEGMDVAVNQDGMPTLTVSADIGGNDGDEAAEALLREDAKREVSALNRAIQNRAEMLLTAGRILAKHQRKFLTDGEENILPFSMTTLAAMMGCHKSTVSRLVADKLVQTPLGMMEMDQLFASSLRQPHGDDLAGRAVRAKVKKLSAAHPDWTDAALADHIKAQGITVARRTVNKYRH